MTRAPKPDTTGTEPGRQVFTGPVSPIRAAAAFLNGHFDLVRESAAVLGVPTALQLMDGMFETWTSALIRDRGLQPEMIGELRRHTLRLAVERIRAQRHSPLQSQAPP